MTASVLQRAVLAALVHALPTAMLAGTALATLAWSAPVRAADPVRTVVTNRMLGEWKTSFGTMHIERNGMRQYHIELFRPGESRAAYRVTAEPTFDGEYLRGELRVQVGNVTYVGSARVGFDRTGTQLIFTLDNNSVPEIKTLIGQRMPVPAWIERDYKNWVGAWQTDFGPLELQPLGTHLEGEMRLPAADGKPARTLTVVLAPDEYGGHTRIDGAWEELSASSRVQGRVEWRLGADRLSWTGERTTYGASDSDPWNAMRDTAAPVPPVTPAPPNPPASPSPTAPTSTSDPMPAPAPIAYQSLNKFDVRLDRLVEARGYPTRQVHAFVTIKNASPSPQYVTSGFLRAVLTDADGVAQEKNQVWRASGEPAALFASTPVVQPGAELKIRYVFTPDSLSVPATLRLSEGGKAAEFPARAL